MPNGFRDIVMTVPSAAHLPCREKRGRGKMRNAMLPALFILLTALLNLLGGALSLTGQLTRIGYLVTLLPGLAAVAFGLLRMEGPFRVKWRHRIAQRFHWRVRHWLPLAFFILAGIAFVSGIAFEPDHNDALSYRIPRMLHWIVANRWHWIESWDSRLNIRGMDFEWSALPLLLFTGSNRAIFLVNFLAYLCLPALIYGTYRRLGVAPRVAWHWMWILPSGYGLILGASDAGNDLLLIVYVLAALFFALRGVERHRWTDLILSLFAAALLSGTKQSALPLLLPWLVAILPGWRALWQHRWQTMGLAAVAVVISAAWISWVNWRHTGDWSGLVLDDSIRPHHPPLLCLTGNVVLILIQNLNPPLLFWRDAWDHWAAAWLQTPLGQAYAQTFEPRFLWLPIRLHPTFAAFGPGLTLLLAIACFYHIGKRKWVVAPASRYRQAILIATALACLVFLLKTAMWQASRYFLPYAMCVIPFLLTGPAQSLLVRQRWWQLLAGVRAALMIAVMLLIAPRSPLALTGWNQNFFISQLGHTSASTEWLQRALPANERVIGVVRQFIDPEVWLWQPVGSRTVLNVSTFSTAQELDAHQLHWIVVSETALAEANLSLEQWLRRSGTEVVDTFSHAYHRWYLVRRNSNTAN